PAMGRAVEDVLQGPGSLGTLGPGPVPSKVCECRDATRATRIDAESTPWRLSPVNRCYTTCRAARRRHPEIEWIASQARRTEKQTIPKLGRSASSLEARAHRLRDPAIDLVRRFPGRQERWKIRRSRPSRH